MAIQQVGGQGVYVITGSGRDPRKTSNGQSWADLVTKQKFMLYQSAYDQAMREYNQGLITEKERQAKMAQIQKQIDAERGAIDKLKLKQLDINQAREIENQRMKAKESLTTVTKGSVGGTGGTRGQKIPSKKEYLGDLRAESRAITTENSQLQQQAKGLATRIPTLQAMAESGEPMFQFLKNANGEQERQYNNIIQKLEDNRTTQDEIAKERDKVDPLSPDQYVEHYKQNVGLPIQVGGTSGGGGGGGKRTTSQYYRTPVDELGSVSLNPQVAAKEQRIRELQTEMAALGVTPDVDVIDRTREIYADKFGQPTRRRLRDRFGRRQPVVEQAVEETVEAPVQQNDLSRFQQPDLTSQIADRRLQDFTAQDMLGEPQVRRPETPSRQAEQEFLGVKSGFDTTGEYLQSEEEDRLGESLDEERARALEVDKQDLKEQQIGADEEAFRQGEAQPYRSFYGQLPPGTVTKVSSPMTRAMDRMEARGRGEDFRFEPSTPEVTDEFAFQRSTPEVVDPFPFQPSTVETVSQEQFDQPPTFEVVDPRIQPEVTEPRLSPTPAPTPLSMQRVKRFGRIPYGELTRELKPQNPIIAAFDQVRNLSVQDKHTTALRLLEQAKQAYGVSSKEYEKTKTQILNEMMKAIDPKKARQLKTVRKIQDVDPNNLSAYAQPVKGISEQSKRLVLQLFPINENTKLEEIESLYANAQKQIKVSANSLSQKKKALQMLDLIYLSAIDNKR